MTNYYFLASLLPPLEIGAKPELPFRVFGKLLKVNLTPADLKQVQTVRRYYDIRNVRSWWLEEELSPYGNLKRPDLEEAHLTGEGLPDYVNDFLDRFERTEDRLHHFPSLVATYFNEEIKEAKGYLLRYLTFDREWRLVAAAFRCKVQGRSLAEELQYEDPYDDLVAQLLAQKDAKSWQLPDRFSPLLELLEENQANPMQLHRALCEYRFEKLISMTEGDFFSIDRLLGYMNRLIIVEKWLGLDQETGLATLDNIVKEAS